MMKNAMKNIYAVVSVMIILAFILCSCEKVIRFKGENLENAEGINLTALVSNDTNLRISVSKAYVFSDIPPIYWEDLYHYQKTGPDSFYMKVAVLPDAELKLSVNDRNYEMRYDPENYCFTSDYRPVAGDRINVQAKAKGLKDVSAEAVIPNPQKIEIVKYEKFYDKKVIYTSDEELTDMDGKDTIVRITLRISDPKNEHNYYRLKVRSLAYDSQYIEYFDATWEYDRVTDIFTSSDVIFKDPRLVESYGGWGAYFSNVFDDSMFNGKEYEFDVETRMRYGDNPRVVIELQSITYDFYQYLRSLMLYRITSQDSYTEALQIYSNVDNGFGILGALGTEKHVINLQSR